MSKRRLAYIAIAGLSIAIFCYAAALYVLGSGGDYAEAASIAEGTSNFKELSARFEELAKKEGGVYAFEVLKRAKLPPNTDTHLLGHVVGDELYKQKGVDGIADCTQDFRNACSHTIVIGALNEFGGEAALGLIREACKKAPGGSGAYTMCYHGLGHGVFAFYGYEFPETVEFCEKTGSKEYREREYVECVGGAVMELMGGGGHDPEAWQKSREKYLTEALSPCMDAYIPDEAKSICLIYITPHIWEAAGINMGHPDPEKFRDAFKFCDAIQDVTLRNSCYDGFGKEFPTLANARDIRDLNKLSDDALAKVVSWCAMAPERGLEPCTLSALRSLFWGGENDPNLSFRYCKVVAEGALQNACYRDLASQMRQYFDGARRAEWCPRLPEEARAMCSQ
ncbi:MAG: hypothetical protein Q8R25_02220 [bacterium]|nr:hypothetical protein [bacterium]